eukprot:CAMPEP_0179196108 /NCGR_PEP_ID=MMETSP0796-20121207/97502_1 /TAXON_ID=73915 /ORGANISM="Pyrodinium bahamense, Strain pbaha01" /LENGTH=31 /DNA_ID= /DNA_START= /DNA_END= /DNA_ORIENTATION=
MCAAEHEATGDPRCARGCNEASQADVFPMLG